MGKFVRSVAFSVLMFTFSLAIYLTYDYRSNIFTGVLFSAAVAISAIALARSKQSVFVVAIAFTGMLYVFTTIESSHFMVIAYAIGVIVPASATILVRQLRWLA